MTVTECEKSVFHKLKGIVSQISQDTGINNIIGISNSGFTSSQLIQTINSKNLSPLQSFQNSQRMR